MALSPRRMAFCGEYVVDHNATQAYIRAGYSKKGASQGAERLLRNVEVKAEIARREAKLAQTATVTVADVVNGLLVIARKENTRAWELLGKHIGMWREQDVQSEAESMTERLERLALDDRAQAPVGDVRPEGYRDTTQGANAPQDGAQGR